MTNKVYQVLSPRCALFFVRLNPKIVMLASKPPERGLLSIAGAMDSGLNSNKTNGISNSYVKLPDKPLILPNSNNKLEIYKNLVDFFLKKSYSRIEKCPMGQ